ncbi:MAG: class I SAM-dependent methyltransferase [Gammaproteobacteria bacterium WSBS_2016_MAG_OTU1]
MGRDLVDYQAQYAEQPYEKYQRTFRRMEIKKILADYPHATMLEVGCGLESIFSHLDSFVKMVVVEPATDFFNKACQDAGDREDVVVINASLEEADDSIKNDQFDFILVSCLLHEIPDQKAFLAAIYNVCHADTVVHFNVPNAESFHRRLAAEMGLIKSVYEPSQANIQFQQHTIFNMELLQHTVEESGFKMLDSGSYAFKPFTHEQMQNMIDSNILTQKILDGLYAMGKHLPSFCSEIYINVRKK